MEKPIKPKQPNRTIHTKYLEGIKIPFEDFLKQAKLFSEQFLVPLEQIYIDYEQIWSGYEDCSVELYLGANESIEHFITRNNQYKLDLEQYEKDLKKYKEYKDSGQDVLEAIKEQKKKLALLEIDKKREEKMLRNLEERLTKC